MGKFETYARYYDQIYHDKDYSGEARYVADLLKRHLPERQARSHIVDLACGTGRHLIELAELGFRVEGSDQSAEMIEVAQKRFAIAGLDARFHNKEFQKCDQIGEKFDAAVALFSSIDYLTDAGDFSLLLSNVKQLMKPQGIFVFDFWNGYAVMRDYSPVRIKDVSKGQTRVIRRSETQLFPLDQIAEVRMSFLVLEGDQRVQEFQELHRMRYYFPREMSEKMTEHGFEIVQTCPFLEPDRNIGPYDWNITLVAKLKS